MTNGSDGWKICVVGAGSTYTPELIEGLIERSDVLPVRELALVDINADRLEILRAMADRMFQAAGKDVLCDRDGRSAARHRRRSTSC